MDIDNSELVSGLLAERFKFYQEPVPFLAAVQPGSTQVDGQTWPALLLQNDAWWFPRRSARPEGVKTKAPAGVRRILTLCPEEQELLVVEGEGDGIAAAFVGYTGLVVAGGVNNLLSAVPEAVKERRLLFAGKQVRILFDPDEPGRKAAVQVARQLLKDGAVKVATLEPPGGEDLEDWLETFPTREEALRELTQLVGSSDWTTDKKLEKQEAEHEKDVKPERVVSERIQVQGDPWPRLVVMTYASHTKKVALALHGPLHEPIPAMGGKAYGDVDWESIPRGWQTGPEFTVGNRLLIPGSEEDVRQFLRTGTLVLPPPPPRPEDELTSEDLWVRVREFMQKWVVHSPELYDIQVAYVFMTYRLEDAGFQRVPYLRYFGPSGSGKNRALDVMKHLVWRGFFTQPSSQNLHRLIDYMGDITLVIDEFHLDRGHSTESRQHVIDVLNYGNDRAAVMTRVLDAKGGMQGLRHFHVFGPKVFAGYGADEEDNLARRTVAIEMRKVPVPSTMAPLGLPKEFYQEAEYLRGQLLAFRGRQLHRGQPDAINHPLSQALIERAGLEVSQTLFPLVSMVPDKLNEVKENVLAYACTRKEAVMQSKGHSDTARLLECFVRALQGAEGQQRDGLFYVTARAVVNEMEDLPTTEAAVGRQLRAEGFESQRPRWMPGRPRMFCFAPQSARHQEVLARYSIEWNRAHEGEGNDEESGL